MHRVRSATRLSIGLLTIATLGLTACGSDDDTASDTADDVTTTTAGDERPASFDAALAAEVVDHYAASVSTSYGASLASAEKMATAIDAFVTAPTADTLAAAKAAWLTARDDYGLTEAFRFYGGPIDNDEDGPEGLMNSWPLDEQYIDYVEGEPTAGMVNDSAKMSEITAEALTTANGEGGEANVATGWHAIEFLLWGQDLSDSGPGNRPVTDYTTEKNAERRKAYLGSVTDLLVEHLNTVVDAWEPDVDDNYRAEFVASEPGDALVKMITGIGELSRGELAGERMNTAYEERSQEDEHSCFSDNTTNDLIANAVGIQQVWTGSYQSGDAGKGIAALVASVDADLADRVSSEIEASIAEIRKIPAPFDSNLGADAPDDGPGRSAIRTSIELLGVQTDSIVEAGKALGVEIEVS